MTLFDTLLEILLLFGYLTIAQSSSGSGGLLKSDQKHRTQKAAEKANELHCYACQTMDVTQGYCMNITEKFEGDGFKSKCEENMRICMVKRVSFMSTGENATHKTWSLERNCTNHCEPGCIIIGERLKLRKCVSCCQGDMCNYGNSAPSAPNTSVPMTDFLVPLLVLIIHSYLNR